MDTIEKKIATVVCICFSFNILVIVADLNNWGSRLLPVNQINYDLLGIVINTSVVITIAILTYIVIDHRNIKREENRKNTAVKIMNSTFTRCLTAIDYFDEYREVNPAIFADGDFLSTIDPFSDYSIVATLSSEGVIECNEYCKYEEIKQLYQLLLFSYNKQYTAGTDYIAKDPLHEKIIVKINESI